ncbi:atp-nad kinase ppnk-type all-beta [Lucifera butyrica]|uniref:NAD kinase n=1 Tax=Lucifera butyrica TaxID=1351585 RepID=A0A498RD54_9FIRM|nr:NAD(+)/NADH kinase [Lucifera butyrica]VBB08003.1 atp-nad kinase ppnk-type all-beta [Lucifera butyrica]
MLTVGVYPNTKKSNVLPVLSRLVQYLQKNNIPVFLPDDCAREMQFPDLGCPRDKMKNEISVGITIGGDGTLLNTAREIAPGNVPVCGINLGQLGFLTEVEPDELEHAMDKLIQGDFHIEERLMLDSFIIRQGKEQQYFSSALNDIVVTKGGFSRLIQLLLYIDGELAAEYSADGLIVATSTGSTGYSLSAGGPIVNPNLRVMVLTPICPHTLHSRSLLIADKEEIRIQVQATHEDAVLTVDGQKVYHLLPEEQVAVRSSNFSARFLRLNGKSYYERLRTKLQRGNHDEIR